MATYEHNALQQYKDSSNNMHVIYPVTKAECIADPQNLSVGNANTVGGKDASAFANSSHTHTKSQITDFPSSLPASDVYSWAKASSKPSYSWSEITSKPTSFTPASHNQAANTVTAGTFAGQVVAPEGTDYTTNRIRNNVLTTTDPGAGVSVSYVNGSTIDVYE